MNKTFAALALAGISFSSMAHAATKTYLKVDSDGKNLLNVSIDLAKTTGSGTGKSINLETGKVTSFKLSLAAAVNDLGLTSADEAVEYGNQGIEVTKVTADATETKLASVLLKAQTALLTKQAALRKKADDADAAVAKADTAITDLNAAIDLIAASYTEAQKTLEDNGATDLKDALVAVDVLDDALNKDVPNTANGKPTLCLKSELKKLQAKLAAAKTAKEDIAVINALEVDITTMNGEIKIATENLANAKTTLASVVAAFTKDTLPNLGADAKKAINPAKAALASARTKWLGYAAKQVAVKAAKDKADAALKAANDAVTAAGNEDWKVLDSFLSISQSQNSKSVTIVLQPASGKAITYSGPAIVNDGSEKKMFVIGSGNYTVSDVGSGVSVNGTAAAATAVLTGAQNQSYVTSNVMDQFSKASSGATSDLTKSDLIYQIKNGKLFVSATKEQPADSGTYVLGSAVTHKLVWKLGLISGTVGKDTLSGAIGTDTGGAPTLYLNADTYLKR